MKPYAFAAAAQWHYSHRECCFLALIQVRDETSERNLKRPLAEVFIVLSGSSPTGNMKLLPPILLRS